MNLYIKSIFIKYFKNWELIFGTFWILWVVTTYLGHHPEYFDFSVDYPYATTLNSVFAISAFLGLTSYFRLRKSKKTYVPIRGISLISIVLILAATILVIFRQTIGLEQESLVAIVSYFIGFSFVHILLLLFLGLIMLAAGSFLTDRLEFKKKPALLSVAFGFSLVSFFSVILALFSIYNMWVVWSAVIIILILKRKLVLSTLRDWIIKKHQWRIVSWWELPMAFIALIIISFYWIGSLKAYALGFDGTSLYANLAHLLVNNIYIPGAVQPYSWSFIMSLGECMFKSETLSLLLSHFMYLPALIMGYHLSRMWLKPAYSLLAMVISLSMPYMGFHAMVDEKIDLGLLFISLSAIYLTLQWFTLELPDKKNGFKSIFKDKYYFSLLLIGWLLGFAFTIKFTSAFLLIGLITVILYRLSNKWFYFGTLSAFIGYIFISGFYKWGNLDINSTESLILGSLFLTTGIGLMVFTTIKNNIFIKKSISQLATLGAAFVLPFLPWGIEHLSEHQFDLSFNNILYGKPDRAPLNTYLELSYQYNTSPKNINKILEPEVRLTSDQSGNDKIRIKNKKEQIGNAKREELQRYIGYENGLWRYTSIPFDLPFSINIDKLRHQEIGFFLLALLPLILLGFYKHKKKNLYHLLIAVGLIIWASNSYWTLTEASSLTEHLNQIGLADESLLQNYPLGFQSFYKSIQLPFIYVGGIFSGLFKFVSTLSPVIYYPILFLMLFGIAQLLKSRQDAWSKEFKLLMLLSFSMLVIWVLLGNAIIWYAFILLIILPILVVFYFQKASKLQGEEVKWASKKILGSVILLQVILNIFILFTSPYSNAESKNIFQWQMIEYISQSDIDKATVKHKFNPITTEIIEEINNHPEAKVYKINTYLQYDIDNNNVRVYEDNQLGRFDRICSRQKDKKDFFKILKQNGFRYILYDFNTPGLDRTPEQSLLEKCKELYRLISIEPSVSLLITDHYVKAPDATTTVTLPNGKKAYAKQGLYGEVVYAGNIALFEIK